MKMSMNNGELGCDLYFDDPDFPRILHVWLESLDDTNLVVSSFAMFLAERNVAGRAVLLSSHFPLKMQNHGFVLSFYFANKLLRFFLLFPKQRFSKSRNWKI